MSLISLMDNGTPVIDSNAAFVTFDRQKYLSVIPADIPDKLKILDGQSNSSHRLQGGFWDI